jgi:glycine betaine/choline ABC-type transport system substrate-binding protein/membrane-associated phospholipid phosphatase
VEVTTSRRAGSALAGAWRLALPRHPGDLVRLVLGAAILVGSAEVVRRDRVGVLETHVFRLVNDLPGALYLPFWAVMQLGNLVAVPLIAAIAALARRYRLAVNLAVAGTAAWLLAKVVKQAVARGRPPSLLDQVHVHGPQATGLGYVSGHAAVAVALASVASPYLSRRMRRVAWLLATIICLARIYVGAHLPLDVVGGAALGWAVGALVHLLLGAPGGRPTVARARRSLAGCGLDPERVEPMGGPDARRSARFMATTRTGERLFVKLIPRERRDADLLYRGWQRLRGGGSTPVLWSPSEQVQREAYLTLAAYRAGVRTPAVVYAGPCDHDAGLMVQRWVPGRSLDQLAPEDVDDDLLRAVWREVAALREARIAHGDLGRESIVVDQRNQPWLVDFDQAEMLAGDDLLAADVAELLASLAVRLGPERPLATAAQVLDEAPVAGALRSARPAALTRTTRRELRASPGVWPALLAKGAAILLLVAGCTPETTRPPPEDPRRPVIRVASFDFPESETLAEIYGQALRRQGYPVELVPRLGPREIVEPALQQGRVDLVPEYLGSALAFLHGAQSGATAADPRAAHELLEHAAAAVDLTALAVAPAQNRNAFVVTGKLARERGLRRLSDLQPLAGQLVLGGPPECPQRPLCLSGLRSVYGLEFQRFQPTSSRTVTANSLETGDIDVGMIETTDGNLVDRDLVQLEDDRRLQPAENVVPVVRQRIVSAYGAALVRLIDGVTARLTTSDVVDMNWRVQLKGTQPAAAATDWLLRHPVRG